MHKSGSNFRPKPIPICLFHGVENVLKISLNIEVSHHMYTNELIHDFGQNITILRKIWSDSVLSKIKKEAEKLEANS